MVTIVAVYISPAPKSVRVELDRVFLVSVGLFNEKIKNRTNGDTTDP